MLDLSESGRQIGEKLFILLDADQRQELIKYVLDERKEFTASDEISCTNPSAISSIRYGEQSLTEIRAGGLYFCLELRKVRIETTEIDLTVKEFDALYLLISNQNRVLTFEMLAYQIWGEEYVDVTAKTIHNLMSRLRQKLQISPDAPKYIVCVRGVGYKFDAEV